MKPLQTVELLRFAPKVTISENTHTNTIVSSKACSRNWIQKSKKIPYPNPTKSHIQTTNRFRTTKKRNSKNKNIFFKRYKANTQENGTLHIYCTIRQKKKHTHTHFKLHGKQHKENISDRCLRIKTECEKCEMR